MARSLNSQYIGQQPGLVKSSNDTKSDILTLLGLTLTPVTDTGYNRTGQMPPLALIEINGLLYNLSDVLTEIRRAIPIRAAGAPTTTTVGLEGQHYLDTTNNIEYTCVNADTSTPIYTWQRSVLQTAAQTSVLDSAENFVADNVEAVLAEIMSYFAEKTGYGILSGLVVSAQDTPDMTVVVTDGIRYKSDGTRQEVAGDASLDVDAADGTYNRQDLIYVDSSGALQYLAGDITVAGQRTYTITTNAGSGDTFTINGTTLTEGVDFSAGVDESATATNLAAALDSALDGTFSASAVGAVITVIEETPGGGDTPSASTIVGTMVVTDGDAVESVTTGDTLPSVPSGGISIAALNVDASTAAITSGMITKTRVWTSPGVND